MPEAAPWLSLAGAVFGALAIVWVAAINRRSARDAAQDRKRSPEPPTTEQVWARLDALELKFAASTRVIIQLIDQWPRDANPAVLDEGDVEVLSDTLPRRFRRSVQTRPAS